MPEGRFLSKSIAHSEQVAEVSLLADYLFTRCIPHLDVEGRMAGNPQLVKAIAVPLRPEITAETIPGLLAELEDAGLVEWYRASARQVLRFPGFLAHQKGIKRDREAASRLPAPNAPDAAPIRTPGGADPLQHDDDSGPTRDEGRSSADSVGAQLPGVGDKLDASEVKSSEVKSKSSEAKKPRRAKPPRASPDGPDGDRDTWLTPARDAWEAVCGPGSFNFGRAARPLARLTRAGLSPEEIGVRLGRYCRARFGGFCTIDDFAEHHGEWATDAGPPARRAGRMNAGEESYINARIAVGLPPFPEEDVA